MVLDEEREDQFDRSCEERSFTQSQGGQEYLTNNKKGGSLTGLVTSCVGTAFYKGANKSDQEGNGSPGTCNPEETGLLGFPVS
jgi:hypothetical protein